MSRTYVHRIIIACSSKTSQPAEQSERFSYGATARDGETKVGGGNLGHDGEA